MNLKMLLAINIFFLLIMLFTKCSSSGNIRSNAPAQKGMDKYYSKSGEFVKYTETREYILHKAGSYQEYAHNINCPEFGEKKNNKIVPIKSINDLMDYSFNILKAHGIEIDVNTIPGNSEFNKVYVVHDAVDEEILKKNTEASNAAKAYLRGNSIDIVLDHFITKGYYRQGKSIHIELKIARRSRFSRYSELNNDEKKYLQAVTSSVKKAIADSGKNSQEQEKIRNHLCFLSFNLFALEETKKLVADSGYKFNFIAATNRPFLGRLGWISDKELNYLKPELIEKVIKADWLDNLWFDPYGMDDSIELFNSINEKRKNKLTFYISTYNLNLDELADKLKGCIVNDKKGNEKKLENVGGLIFEIQSFDDPDKRASCK